MAHLRSTSPTLLVAVWHRFQGSMTSKKDITGPVYWAVMRRIACYKPGCWGTGMPPGRKTCAAVRMKRKMFGERSKA